MDPVTIAVLSELAATIVASGAGKAWARLRRDTDAGRLREVVERTLERGIDATVRPGATIDRKRLARDLAEAFRGDAARILTSSLDSFGDERARAGLDEHLRAAITAGDADLDALRADIDVDRFVQILPDVLVDEVMRAADLQSRLTMQLLSVLVTNTRPDRLPELSGAELRADVERLLRGIVAATEDPQVLPRHLHRHHDVTELTRPVSVRTQVRRASAVRRRADGENTAVDATMYEQPGDHNLAPTLPWPEVVHAEPRIVVLGDPGMGKSWLIRAETRRLANAALETLTEADVPADLALPVMARCDELARADGDRIGEALAQVLGRRHRLAPSLRHWLADQVDSGSAVILLDSWDELRQGDDQNRVRDLLAGMLAPAADGTGGQRCVITSRLAGYVAPPLARPLAEVELRPFDPDDVEATVAGWRLPVEAEGRLRARLAQPASAEMARNPLLLSLLCALAADGEELPSVRWQLFERITDQYLRRDRARPATGGRDDQEVERYQRLSGVLAVHFATRDGGWADTMSVREMEDVLGSRPETAADAGAVVQMLAVESGLLTRVGGEVDAGSPYRFVHRTIGEYLVARELKERGQDDWLAAVDRHLWFDRDWVEVIPMLGGQLHDVRPLLDHLLGLPADALHLGLRTAARIVAERPDAAVPALAGQVDEIIARLLADQVKPGLSEPAVAALGVLAPVVSEAALRPVLDRLDSARVGQSHLAVALAGAARRDSVRRALLAVLDDTGRWTPSDVIEALGGVADHPDVRAALLTALATDDQMSRAEIVRALAGAVDHDDVREALLRCLTDRDRLVRDAAIDGLSRACDQQSVRRAMVTQLDGHPDAPTRTAVARAMAPVAAGRPDLVGALCRAARSDVDPLVRGTSAGALAGAIDDELVRQTLIEVARTDASVWPVDGALAALAGAVDHEDVHALFVEKLADTGAIVRVRVDSVLGDILVSAEAQARLLVLLHSDDPEVRFVAVRALGRVAEPAEYQAAFEERVRDDPDLDVRMAAARALTGTLNLEPRQERVLLIRLLSGGDAREWLPAARLMAEAGSLSVVGDAVAALLGADADAKVRRHAMRLATDDLERADVRAKYVGALDDEDPLVRREALDALTGVAEYEDVLAAMAARIRSSPHDNVRRGAAEALAVAADASTCRTMLGLLRDHPAKDVRSAALVALSGCLDDDEFCGVLLDQLTRTELSWEAERILRDRDGFWSPEQLGGRLAAVCAVLESAPFVTKVAAFEPLVDLTTKAYAHVPAGQRADVHRVLAELTEAVGTAS
ncbi:HEAT repeat domain-containing protein [Jiangella alkaliphila]|uniref:HEAT repeat-containing protein n=1 Tax=Jiangella alkaliphila TaxID=419479 RepID=A0A1H2LTE7_9ACTN|nr:HEAT repeat domain-containing protein [Jiangella alkaliphila]SDU83968.1 HEAT repeat-containing protein [Jiangella alkaliphila]